jgi:hypothetical protein
MTQTQNKSNKPNDPPYAGGEDESKKNQNTKPGATEPPVDESDDGPSAG